MGDGSALDGKAVVVTGGASGIGHGVARAFLAAGAAVAVWDADAGALAWAEKELSPLGRVLPLQVDVADEGSVARAAEKALAAFGGCAALVNNAGIMVRKPLAELSLAEWNHVLGVNLTGPMLCSRALAPALAAAPGGGTIVNIASTRAFQSEPNTEAYAASKGGITALTHALALSLGPAVRVNCIAPGWIDVTRLSPPGRRTPEAFRPEDHAQHPAGRVGTPDDVAALALFLCSESAGFMTGETLVLDGGMTRKMIYAE